MSQVSYSRGSASTVSDCLLRPYSNLIDSWGFAIAAEGIVWGHQTAWLKLLSMAGMLTWHCGSDVLTLNQRKRGYLRFGNAWTPVWRKRRLSTDTWLRGSTQCSTSTWAQITSWLDSSATVPCCLSSQGSRWQTYFRVLGKQHTPKTSCSYRSTCTSISQGTSLSDTTPTCFVQSVFFGSL